MDKLYNKLVFLNQQITDCTEKINELLQNLPENNDFYKYADLADLMLLKKMIQQEESELESHVYSTFKLNFYKEELLKRTNVDYYDLRSTV